MSLTQLAPPYPIFTDKNGDPLDAGYLYFGVVNLNPETNPIQVYWDAALTQPAAQPVRTINGYPSRNGSPAAVYTDQYFSVTVRNKRNELVIYSPTGFGVIPFAPVTFASSDRSVRDVSVLLADVTFTYSPSIPGTIQVFAGDTIKTLIENFSYEVAASGATDQHVTTAGGVKLYVERTESGYDAKAFGAVGDGVANDTAALQKAIDVVSDNGGTLSIPTGTYNVSARLTRLTSAQPFIVQGDGRGTILKRISPLAASVIEFRQSDGVQVRDLVIDGQHSVLGAANHGLVIFESDFVRVENVHVRDYTNSGILVYALAGSHGRARIMNCSVNGFGRSPVGILISGMYDSGMHGCTAIGCTTVGTGSDGYGLELKNECDGCFITDSYAFNCTVAAAFGQDILTTAVKNSRVSVIARRCSFGFVCGKAENNHIDLIYDATGISLSGQQVVDIQTDSIGNSVRVTVERAIDAKRVARIRSGCVNNFVDVSLLDFLPSTSAVALFDAGSSKNTVKLSRLGTSDFPANGFNNLVVFDSTPADQNTFTYDLANRFENVTISGGVATVLDPSSSSLIIDTESGAATDDLDTITLNGVVEGHALTIRTLSNVRDITVKHNTGNILLNNRVDFTLDGAADTLSLRWNSALLRWCETGRGDNVA